MTKLSKLAKIQRLTHNPLLMVNGCNPIPLGGKVYKYGRGELQRHDIIPFYEQFQTLYKESTKQTAPESCFWS